MTHAAPDDGKLTLATVFGRGVGLSTDATRIAKQAVGIRPSGDSFNPEGEGEIHLFMYTLPDGSEWYEYRMPGCFALDVKAVA